MQVRGVHQAHSLVGLINFECNRSNYTQQVEVEVMACRKSPLFKMNQRLFQNWRSPISEQSFRCSDILPQI